MGEQQSKNLNVTDLLGKHFLVKDKMGINGSDWEVKFTNDPFTVTEIKSSGKELSHKCELADDTRDNYITINSENKPSYMPYSWMVENRKGTYYLWVCGQGGAMDFEMSPK